MREWLEKLNDPTRDVYERRYRLHSAVSIILLTLWLIFAWIVDGYSLRILIFGLCDLLFIPTMIWTLRTGKIQIGAGGSGIVLVFLMLPASFFLNGGIYAGAPNWCIIALIFVTLTIRGNLRKFLLACDMIITALCYLLTWKFPELVDPYTVASAYADSLASLIITAVLTSTMFLFQMYMAKQEREILTSQQQEILELNSAQNRFFSSMSHEIRTPVNTIIGLNEMILREDVSEEVAEDAGQVRAAGRMLLHLVNDILDMSKLESGRMELTEEAFSIGDMLSEIVGMMWIHAEKKGLAFHVNVSATVPARLYGDEMRIKQVLINVLNNAVKYTEKGSVSLSVRENQGMIVFTISDTGVGIKKESIPNLFTAFKRVESDENRKIEGTGLGLSIVKQLVDLMGGQIGVSSVYMQGTTFTIEIPEKRAGEETVGDLNIEERHALNSHGKYVRQFIAPKARILIVDDNEANLMVAAKLLRDTQMQIDTVSNGESALQKTMENRYHLIFMDHLMPGMDGITCLHLLRSQTGGMNRDTKVVALTANADSGSRQLYAGEGFDGYLVKPVIGSTLEHECIRLLPRDLVQITAESRGIVENSVLWMHEQERRVEIRITTDSIADLPKDLTEKYGIAMIPHAIHTAEGIFLDGREVNAESVVSYMEQRQETAQTLAPEKSDYESFFAQQLAGANQVIHISISGKVPGSGMMNAQEAGKSFHNVNVVDSHHLSSGEGLLALEAAKMAKEGQSLENVLTGLENIRDQISSSFIVDNLDYMVRSNLVGTRIAKISNALMIRPVLRLRNGEIHTNGVYLGSRKRAWQRYVASELKSMSSIDPGILFVTHVGLSQDDLKEIKHEIEKRGCFDSVIFQKASPAIAVNCGPGTFGLLYKKRIG